MRPLLLQWRGLKISSYPAMLYLGLLLGVVAGNIAAHAARIDAFRVYLATLILIVPALAGARLLYVATHWHFYRNDPRRIWDRSQGGCSMYGGLPFTLVLSVPLLRALHLSFGVFWDVASFTILTGMIFARLGCLLNGCCAGRPSCGWLGLYLPNRNGSWQKRIPTQALEAGWAAILIIVAVAVRRLMPFPGALFLLVSLGYAAGRMLMEFARERKPKASGLSVAHVISIVITLLSISTLTFYWRQ
jgi:phosphatidylglycerol---prolipoprotein diacylglyceryl transferase